MNTPVMELYSRMLLAEAQYEAALAKGWEGETMYAIKATLNACRFRWASALDTNLIITDTGIKEAI